MGRAGSPPDPPGSPVVRETRDFNSALLTPEGEGLFVGIRMTPEGKVTESSGNLGSVMI